MILLEKHIISELKEKLRFCDYCNDLFLQLPSRSSIKKAIKKGTLRLNGSKVESGRWLKENDEITLVDLELNPPKPYDLNLEVVFEDDYFAIINKPSGIVVSGNQFKTIENCLSNNIKSSLQIDALQWPRPVHRLDAPTSGLLVISKTKKAHMELGLQFEHKLIQKKYVAIVQGEIEEKGRIENVINDQEAITEFNKIKSIPSLRNEYLSLVELFPLTGRTHQLRIHMSGKNCPIVGDKLYGKEGNILLHKGLFLSAIALELLHPITKEKLNVKIDVPNKFNSYLEREKRMWNKYKMNT